MPFWFHEFSRIFTNRISFGILLYFHDFFFQLIFPAEFPFKPPSIYMTTPNGRFKTHTRLCLSISDYHPDTWNPGWSVGTILIGLLSFMLERSPTLGSIGNVRFYIFRQFCTIDEFCDLCELWSILWFLVNLWILRIWIFRILWFWWIWWFSWIL